MKNPALAGLIILLTWVTWLPDAHAQWAQPEGESYGKVWSRFTIGSKGFDTEGELFDTERWSLISMRIYGEHGLTDRWTLVGIAEPVTFSSYGDEADDKESEAFVGPLIAGLRSAILTGPLKLALEMRLGYTPQEGEVNLADDTDSFVFIPAFSGGQAAFELQFGYSFSSFWTQLRWGLAWYSHAEVDPASIARFQLGWSGPAGVVLDVRSYYHKPIADLVVTNVAGAGQTEFISLGLGASWWFIDHLALAVGVDGAIMAKSNAGAPVFTIGFEAK